MGNTGYAPRKDFTASSVDIKLNGAILEAQCKDGDGHLHPSRLNLDDFIDNSDGFLMGNGHNFSKSSRNIRLERASNGHTILHAECAKVDGNWRASWIDLDAFIGNEFGTLKQGEGDLFDWIKKNVKREDALKMGDFALKAGIEFLV